MNYLRSFLLSLCLCVVAVSRTSSDDTSDHLVNGITVHSTMDDVRELAKKKGWDIYKVDGRDMYIRDERPQSKITMHQFVRFGEHTPIYISSLSKILVDGLSEEKRSILQKAFTLFLSSFEIDAKLMAYPHAQKIRDNDEELIIEYKTSGKKVRYRMDKAKLMHQEVFVEYSIW